MLKTYDLSVTEQELGVIATALIEAPLPYKMTAPVIQTIEQQVNEQKEEVVTAPVKQKKSNGHAAASR